MTTQSTSSTIPVVKTRIVTVLTARAALAGNGLSAATGIVLPDGSTADRPAVQVEYAWPGNQEQAESIFWDEEPASTSSEIPNISAGRKQRQEDYTLSLVIHAFQPHLTSAGATFAEARGFQILAEVEGELANDPTLGLDGAIQYAQIAGYQPLLRAFEKGWASQIVTQIQCKARLH